jgi:hypothetical protein
MILFLLSLDLFRLRPLSMDFGHGWPSAQIDAARALSPDMKCCGREVTLNFCSSALILLRIACGSTSPEYEAFGAVRSQRGMLRIYSLGFAGMKTLNRKGQF